MPSTVPSFDKLKRYIARSAYKVHSTLVIFEHVKRTFENGWISFLQNFPFVSRTWVFYFREYFNVTNKSSISYIASGKNGVNEIVWKNNYLTKFSNIFLVRTSEQKLSSEDRIVDGAFINITNVPYMASSCIHFLFLDI